LAIERTLCIIKPDAVEKKQQGAILQQILDAGFEVVALKQVLLTESQARKFYAIHEARSFYVDLVRFMSSGPIVVAALSAPDAVLRYRTLIGATDPAKADAGTIRKLFGTGIEKNAVHGSDSPENGLAESAFFFSGYELG
jgi:nucleoside-diphosphate kinase